MKKILITDGMDKGAVAALKEKGFDVTEQFFPPEELGNALRGFDAVVVRSATKVRKEHIDAAKGSSLKLIIRGGVGVDNIDVAYAEENGITVKNTPAASSASVAETALAHMFSCAHYISIAGHTMREGKWEKKAYGKGFEVCGKTLGIIGYGRIGRELAKMAKGLGMRVLAYELRPVEDELVNFVYLEELLAKSDFISIHLPALKQPIIDAEAIAQMKDGAVLINTSRGCNVDEKALLDALNSGKLRGAGLDVYEEEPTHDQALLDHPAVSCTPHIGAATVEAQKRIGFEVVDIISAFFA